MTHTAGKYLSVEANKLFRRRTDEFIKEKLDRQSLDVGADRIARTALRALQILNQLAERLSTHIPLAWTPQISGSAAIEVYPAATLAAYNIPARSYKEVNARFARKTILDHLQKLLVVQCPTDRLLESADALDAIVCVLAGADFLRGDAYAPDDLNLAIKKAGSGVGLEVKSTGTRAMLSPRAPTTARQTSRVGTREQATFSLNACTA